MGCRLIQSSGLQELQFHKPIYLRDFQQRNSRSHSPASIKHWTMAILAAATLNGVGLPAETTERTKVEKADLTARECLALARQERQKKNWTTAAAYYDHLEAEYTGSMTQTKEAVIYRLEHLDCLLVSKEYADSIRLIDSIRAVPSLPHALVCELLFEKGKSEYQLQRFASARASLLVFLKAAQEKIRSAKLKLKTSEAYLLVAQCLISENRFDDALTHLTTDFDPDAQTKAIATLLKIRLWLELKHPQDAYDTLKTSLSEMRSWNLPASCDELLLETANQFVSAAEHEKAIECVTLTIAASITTEAINQHMKKLESQPRLPDKTSRPGQLNAEYTRVLSILSNELNVAREVQEKKPRTVKTIADTLIADGRFRDAAALLRTFTSGPDLSKNNILYQLQYTLLGCLLQLQRWDDAIQMADSLQNQGTEPRPRLELSLLKGIALSKSNSPVLAIQLFETICRESAGTPCSARASILCASTQLQIGRYQEAIRSASDFIASNPKHPLGDTAHYLLTAGQLAAKQHEKALESASLYLKDRSKTENREVMFLYKAKAQRGLLALRDAADTLKRFMTECQAGEMNNQARLLLGDTLLTLGETDHAFEALQAVSSEDPILFDEAKLRLANALGLLSRTKDSEKILTEFAKLRVSSNRIAEACRELLKTSSKNDTLEEALNTLWSPFGHPDQACRNASADEIITILEKAYLAHGDQKEFERRSSCKLEALLSSQSNTTLHCHCSIALLWAKWKRARRENPTGATMELLALENATRQMPSMVPPQVFSDLARHLDTEGESERALATWRELLKWNPQTPFKDRALLRLGSAAAKNGETTKAVSLFERLENECGRSALIPEMLLNRAAVHLKNNDQLKQIEDLMRIASSKSAPLPVRAEALVELGELKIRKQEYANAIVYLQRAYVTCIASREHAARAYERCAFAFQKLNNFDAAAQVYSELLQHPDLANTAAANECRSQKPINQ